MFIIKQAYIGVNYRLFKTNFLNKYGLKVYYDKNSPCIFYGLGKEKDIEAVKKHKSYKIIVFCGSDIIYNKKHIPSLKKLKNIFFISISKFIGEKLNKYNIKSKNIPISPTINKNLSIYKPVKKGNSICIYTGLNTRLDIYGFKIWKKLVADFKDINFIVIVNPIHYKENKKHSKIKINNNITLIAKSYNTYNLLYENVYKKCFLGLRLTANDGNSAFVHELGLLGIKSIHNGYQPCAINYKYYSELVNIIKRERDKVGTIDAELHEKMITFTKINDNWLNIKYYI